ncbi:MAG: hypothetical protein V4492_08375 [Chlamydiota bacterium]
MIPETPVRPESPNGYFHRDFRNDLGTPAHDYSLHDMAQRIALVALPFASLYKPFHFPLALGTGALRLYTNVTALMESVKQGDTDKAAYQCAQTVISTAAFAGTVIAHPFGMVLTTANDLVIDVAQLGMYLKMKNYEKVMERCGKIASNTLYLAFILDGGLKLAVGSLASQALLGLYESQKEWKAGNWLEAAGHFGMTLARCRQLQIRVKSLQADVHIQDENHKRIEEPIQMAENHKRVEERIKTHESNSKGWSPLHSAIEAKDEEAALQLLNTRPELAKTVTPGIELVTQYLGMDSDSDKLIHLGNEEGIAPIELAVKSGCSTKLVSRLIELGADPSHLRKEHRGYPWTYRVSRMDYITFMTVDVPCKLIETGINSSYQEYNALYWAIINKDQAMVDFLISKGCKLDAVCYVNKHQYRGEEGYKMIRVTDTSTGADLLARR